MPTLIAFRLQVAADGGRARALEIVSASADEAVRRAAQLGLVVLSVEPAVAAGPAADWRAADFSLLLFSQELLALLEAGLHLNEALATLIAKERQAGAVALLRSLAAGLDRGRNFSDVLGDHPRQFPPVYAAIVRAAERTGDLPQALTRFIAYQQQFDAIRKKLVSACVYPALLLVVGAAVTLFLLAYVVPRFSQVYASAGRELPAVSAGLLAVGGFIQHHGLLLALLAAAALLALLAGLARGGWGGLAGALLRLPGVASRAAQFRLARFYRALSLLLAAGIALPRALAMVDGLLSPAERRRLARARSLVERGQPLSQALVAEDLASAVARSLLTVGERSGQLGDMLERSARFQDDELDRWLDWASRLLEPVMMLLIGVIIGGVVLLMYLPIFDLAGGL